MMLSKSQPNSVLSRLSCLFFGLVFCLLTERGALAAQTPGKTTPDKHKDPPDYQEAKAAKALLASPPPSYSLAARRLHAVGSGVAILQFDPETGRVSEAHMSISTGSTVLDEDSLKAFRQWRVVPHTFEAVRIPITYTMGGDIGFIYDRKTKSVDEMLASYLRKGTVLRAPIPEYPGWEYHEFKKGKGVYEIHADPAGGVESVRVLQSSGDAVFDNSVEKTLRKWKFNRGPLVVELPLAFRSTPNSYRVDIAR